MATTGGPTWSEEPVDDLEYEALAWLAAGNKVFRPREATARDEEAFRAVIPVLGRLRQRGLVSYLDGPDISQSLCNRVPACPCAPSWLGHARFSRRFR
jgi:hypothetical protein